MPRPSTRGGFTAPANEVRRLAGDLLMVARYPDLADYRRELEAMSARLVQIVDELTSRNEIDTRIGLPPTPPTALQVPAGAPPRAQVPIDLAALAGEGGGEY